MPGSLIQGNALCVPLKDKSVQLCCFSPPYWKLRKYKVPNIVFGDPDCIHVWGKRTEGSFGRGDSLKKGPGFNGYAGEKMSRKPMAQGRFCTKCGAWEGQLGLEPTIDQYLDNLMLVMAEVWRVLRDDGCVFVNIGDSYWSPRGNCSNRDYGKHKVGEKSVGLPLHRGNKTDNPDIRPKSLCLVPQRFAIRCQEAGWIVRSEVIFHKLNPIPESCNDRPTKSHEQVWILTKTGKYFWDKEAVKERTRRIAKVGWKNSDLKKYSCDPRLKKQGTYKDWRKYCPTGVVEKRNIRSVWTMATEPTPEAHFATFPSKLVRIMVLAGSSPRACEICGAPWRRVVKREEVMISPDAEEYSGKNYAEGGRSASRRLLKQMSELRGLGRDHDTPYLKTRTVGWRKTCKCKCAGTGRCVVLDPFVGIGTTVVMAEKQGRSGVGMDLSLEYLVDIALKKISTPIQKMLELR